MPALPLQNQTLEIQLEGLDQKTDHKALKAGKLTRAQNVEFDKGGVIRKRRGYRRYQFSGPTQIGAFGHTMESQALRVTAHKDELLIFGVGWLWSIGSKTAGLDGHVAVRRGRIGIGNTRRWRCAGAGDGSGS